MNITEIGRLLTIIAELDQKMPEPDEHGFMQRLWAGLLDDVPFDAAQRAVKAYYRSDLYVQTRNLVSPADIVQWWNARRRPNEAERSGANAATRREIPPPPVDPDVIRRGVTLAIGELAAAKALRRGEDPEDARAVAEGNREVRRLTMASKCDFCGAQPEQPCTKTLRGKQVEVPPHSVRGSVVTESSPLTDD